MIQPTWIAEWIAKWLERRELRRKVEWKDCVWSPQKAAEERYIRTLTDYRVAMFRLQAQGEMAKINSDLMSAKRLQIQLDAWNEARRKP